jgi:hypothetical protein
LDVSKKERLALFQHGREVVDAIGLPRVENDGKLGTGKIPKLKAESIFCSTRRRKERRSVSFVGRKSAR